MSPSSSRKEGGAVGTGYDAHPHKATAVVRFSLGLQVVSDRALLADGEVAGLAEVFGEIQSLGFGNFMAEVRDQKAYEFLLTPRAGGGGFTQVLQYLSHPFVQGGRLGLGL